MRLASKLKETGERLFTAHMLAMALNPIVHVNTHSTCGYHSATLR